MTLSTSGQGELSLIVDGNATQSAIDSPSDSLARLLRALRERALLTQEELAARSGVSVGTIAGLESGRTRRPRSASLRLLADALGLSAEDRAALRTAAGGGPEPVHDRTTAVPVVVPAQLPPDLAEFTGREAYVKRLDELLPADPESRPASVVISAIGGTAGIGKTALAVHWAHRVAGQFPDGQLYVNLRGFGGGAPVDPAEAVRGLIEALGVPPARIPASLDGRVGLYRSLLAGRRVLIVLDNARDSEQVRPLLPGSPGCLVIVTSRNLLAGLVASDAAQPLQIDLPSLHEARQLLERRLGRDRIEREPEAVDEIIARCARLPLGLAIVAARAATHPAFPLQALAVQLRESAGGLDAFASGDAATDLRVVLSWSYQRLSDPAARLFRLLGLHAGPDIAVPAAASLAGVEPARVRVLLAELVHAQLLTEPSPGRYAFHDLLRAYAAELARDHDPEPDRLVALGRLLDHYLHSGYAATHLLQPHHEGVELTPGGEGVIPEAFPDRAAATEWLVREYPSILAVLDRAAASRAYDAQVWRLAWALEVFLQPRGLWELCAASQRVALAAASRLGDRLGQAYAHRMLGRASARLGRYAEAEEQYRLASARFAELGDRVRVAYVQLSLAWMRERQGRVAEALALTEQALAAFRATDNRLGQANALNMVGWFHARLGDYRRALEVCRQALALHEALDYRAGAAATWDSLGYAHHHLGDHVAAADCYRQALRRYQEAGDRFNQADVLTHLGETHHAAGERDAARECWRQAVTIFDELGLPDADRLRDRLRDGLASPGTPEPERGERDG